MRRRPWLLRVVYTLNRDDIARVENAKIPLHALLCACVIALDKGQIPCLIDPERNVGGCVLSAVSREQPALLFVAGGGAHLFILYVSRFDLLSCKPVRIIIKGWTK